MRDKKYYIALDDFERRVVVNCLNEMRNNLIAKGKFMEKHFYNEQTGISYTLQGDYYLPDLALPDEEEQPIGLWGQRHLRYIRQHRKVLYLNLLTSGKLNGYLADLDKQAEEIFSLPLF